jgi:hypothetical protein
MIWRKSNLFTLSTDVVLFILTVLFIAHIVSSTMSGVRRFPTTALLWLHLPLLTLLYAVGKALRVHAYVNEDCRAKLDDEAQEDREIAMFRQESSCGEREHPGDVAVQTREEEEIQSQQVRVVASVL